MSSATRSLLHTLWLLLWSLVVLGGLVESSPLKGRACREATEEFWEAIPDKQPVAIRDQQELTPVVQGALETPSGSGSLLGYVVLEEGLMVRLQSQATESRPHLVDVAPGLPAFELLSARSLRGPPA